jgi:hypothetical protein
MYLNVSRPLRRIFSSTGTITMTMTTRTMLVLTGLFIAAAAYAQDATLPAVPKRYTKTASDSSAKLTAPPISSTIIDPSNATLPAVPKRYTKTAKDSLARFAPSQTLSPVVGLSDSTLPSVPRR